VVVKPARDVVERAAVRLTLVDEKERERQESRIVDTSRKDARNSNSNSNSSSSGTTGGVDTASSDEAPVTADNAKDSRHGSGASTVSGNADAAAHSASKVNPIHPLRF
jgi:hypothetical protein